ncbi:MAG TPA: aminotransferase class III-fold pyridoxal phosphate-dependent enzyme, partial [Gemmatimonadaceae bacterium]|nr:aminotransferase class III-fold pyridoxal phosphate-dependent enzyme [Gemmatimonadaceae bacterium]
MAFFKWRKSEPAPAGETEAPTDDDAVEQPEDEQPEGALDDDEDAHDDDESDDHEDDGGVDEDVERSWRARAAAVIVGGASTGSKRPEALYGAGADFGPTHFARASGCRVTTAAGATLIDCTMALGAVAIGYGDRLVTQSVIEAAAAGSVAGLSPTLEVDVAERLCDVIPCAERVRFLKTGAEAVAAAVRIARAATGRTHVIGSGYFGWLGWWGDAATPGVTAGERADYTHVPFDDVAALERAAAAAGDHRLAAVVLEPVVERLPSTEWIAAARALCDRTGAVLVFDEIKTGFRLAA